MRFIATYMSKLFIVQCLIISFGLAAKPDNMIIMEDLILERKESVNQSPLKELPVNQSLITLFNHLINHGVNQREIETTLAKLTLSKTPLNAAEQYLLLVVKALFEEVVNNTPVNSDKIIAMLQPATQLATFISEQQLSRPEYLQLYLLLAKHYEKIGRYDLAYLEKTSYLKKYNIYRKNKRLDMIRTLEESFEVANKKATNALLESQNKLKALRVVEVQEEKYLQRYNFTLIMGVAIVFILLFIRQLRIRNRLVQLNKTDALTALPNRSALFEYGKDMIDRFTEKPDEFSILLVDVDHFKKVNGHFGHQIGDEVLKIIAQLANETMRSRDVFARLGGEEFVGLLPYADNNKAKAIAMRINEKIAAYNFSTLMEQERVTVSIGVATMEYNNMTFGTLLHNADLAMYQGKEQGRNSVVCYQHIAAKQERRLYSDSFA